MLSGAGLSQYYWEESINITCYIVNMSSMSDLFDKTPYEGWASKRNSLAHLRVFGGDAFVHIPKERRHKFHNKLEKCIFIGYKDVVKGYKMWNLATFTEVYTRDVIFREVGSTSNTEEVKIVTKLENIEFDLNNEINDSNGSTESKEEVEVQTSVMRRSGQARKQPKRYSPHEFCLAFILSSTKKDPRMVKEAIDSTEGKLWKKSTEEEMESLRKRDTWDLVTLPDGKRRIGSKWVFKKKKNASGRVENFNSQLVAKGYLQVEGVNFGEIISPVAKLTSIRLLMSLDTTFDLEIEKMDVKT